MSRAGGHERRGSGRVFALPPPENATGNFVRVVQRIPVKVMFDGPAEEVGRLAPGMAVAVTIDTAGHESRRSYSGML
jgi:membrane fusion protein, multidrug efflux system